MARITTAGVLLGLLAMLLAFSLRLAATRLYEVGECTNVSAAVALAAGHPSAGTNLFQIVLSRLLPSGGRSTDLLASARLVMLLVFWTNWMLLALATGERLLSLRWCVALIGAASLVPWWIHGFEVTQGNLILSALLLVWSAMRFRPATVASCAFLGAAGCLLGFLSLVTLLYTVPLSVAVLAFPQTGTQVPRSRLIAAWAAGALGALLLLRFILGITGNWEICRLGFFGAETSPHSVAWSHLGEAIVRLLLQAPLLWALFASAVIGLATDFYRHRKQVLNWEGTLPEFLLCAAGVLVFVVKGATFPNLVCEVVPFVFLLVFRHVSMLWESVITPDRRILYPAIAGILVFVHLVPFHLGVRDDLAWSNMRQNELMNLAEKLTGPAKGLICDGGAHLVATRRDVGSLKTLAASGNVEQPDGTGRKASTYRRTQSAAVFLPNYRTDWLPAADHAYIRRHYVSLADDFWVLGKVLPKGGGTFNIIHAGRYRISTLQASDLAGTYPNGIKVFSTPEAPGTVHGSLDGAPLPNHPVVLAVGRHQIKTTPGCQPAVVWVGPHLDRPHRLSPGDHRFLFQNWY